MANWSYHHYQLVLGGTLILGLLSGLLVSRLQLQSDVVNLLPSNAPATKAFVQFLQEFGSADSLFIVLERKSGGEVAAFTPFAEVLAERLMASGEVQEIHGLRDPAIEASIEKQFLPKALLYLTEEELHLMESKLQDTAIEQRIRALKSRLHSPLGSWASQWLVRDPLDLWPLFKKHIPAKGPAESSGYLLSEDRKMMLLIAKPKGAAPDIRYDEILVEKVRSAERAAREIFTKRGNTDPGIDLQDLQIGLAGGYINALEDSRVIKKELMMNFSVSLIGVLTIFILAFGRGRAILYALLPLMMSPLLTLGLFSPFLGRLSESTGAFSAIILGLSIDFVILLYSRYLEERKAGEGIPEALEKSLSHTGPGVFTGAVTTAAAYYALLFSDFRGIKELGLLTGTGILLSLGCAFFLFPALVAWREKGKKRTVPVRDASSFGLERLGSLALQHPWLIISLCAAITLGAIGWAFRVRLNNDPRRLRPAGHSSLVLEERIREKMGEGGETLVVLAGGHSLQEALEVQGRIKVRFEEAMASGLPIFRYENLAAFIPPLSQQKRNLEWIETRAKGTFNPLQVAKNLKGAIQKEGLRIEPFEAGLEMLQKMLANREVLTWEAFQGSPLKPIGERFLKIRGDNLISASYLHVQPGFWTDPKAKAFMEGLKEAAPDLQVTGSKLVQSELENLMATEAWSVSLIALAGVFVLIYLGFRSWRLTLISLLPVVLASFWTLGFMGLLGMDLNFMNVVVFTMVLGVGVDYGVHILFRGIEGGEERLQTGLSHVGKGVVLAALTTLMGFGSLVLSGYPGLRSMGAVALMGVGFSALIALTLLPVLMQKLLPKRLPSPPPSNSLPGGQTGK